MMRWIEEFLVGNVTFPLTSALYNRRGILPTFRKLKKSEFYSPDQLSRMQREKLKELVLYAYQWIPFYRKRFKDVGLMPEDIRTLKDLENIPAIARQEVIDYHHDMVDSRFLEQALSADASGRATGAPIFMAPFRQERIVRNTSSGSTGAPTTFYEDGSRTALNWVHELRLRSWFGLNPGAREARMARISTDYLPGARDIRMRRRLWNQLVLPGVNLGPEDFQISYEKLKEFKPRVLWGFTSALAGFAGFLREQNLDPGPVRPELIITWAAPLYEHEEQILREIFDCHVTNIYGAREVGHIAMRCPEGNFHVNEEFILIEEDRSSMDGGQAGELLVTTLDITIMPFLRYRMGDLGRLARKECACGRTLLQIEELLGRTGEIFQTRDGRMISPNFWCRTFMNPALSGRVVRFQVVYKKDDEIEIRIIRGDGYNEDTRRGLEKFLGGNFGQQMKVYITHVDEILPQVSGKYQMVVNEAAAAADKSG